jgi:plasmid maintenance system antidote protein VapI
MRYATETTLIQEMKREAKLTSQRRVAKILSLSDAYISNLLKRKVRITKGVADRLGYEQVVFYKKKKNRK